MNKDVAKIAERLAERYAQLPLATVVRVVDDCATGSATGSGAESARADPAAVEQLASRKLAELSGPADPAAK